MAKRPADELLEDVAQPGNSPLTKKVRTGTEPRSKQSNGASQFSTTAAATGKDGDGDVSNSDPEADPGVQANQLTQDGSGESGEETMFAAPSRQDAPAEGYNDLYLDTIDRTVLDFDFEKLCSISLSNMNVYACLVCGKYFQGRGPKSHAYFHALDVGHHVFVNMQTKKVYVLPEGYEVKSKSLEDIKFVVDPHLSKQEITRLDKETQDSWDLGGKKYQPGKMIVVPSAQILKLLQASWE